MFPQIFGKYVLEREIATGGMARVYLATLRGAVGFEKRLVVKQIRTELASDPAFVARFVEEAKTAVELSHPNIVPVYELGVEQGVYYIAMELCEGLTLSEVLAETGPLGPAEGAHVGAEICRALDYAHRRANIVHRDVTPRNVMIDEEGAVRLIDFGIAAPSAPAGDSPEVFGSPGHMPPEQLNGGELSPATDVFAVGVLLIEAWTGYPPFRRASSAESEHALFEIPPPIDRQEPQLAPLRELIAKSVALDVRARPSGAEEMARPLREFSKTEDSGDLARRLGARVQRARQRSRSSTPWLPGDAGTVEKSRRAAVPNPPWAAATSPPQGAASTRTFAARDGLEVWTRKLPSTPVPLSSTHARAPRTRPFMAAEARASVPTAASDPGHADSRDLLAVSPEPALRVPRRGPTLSLMAVCATAFVVAAFAFARGPSPPPARPAPSSPDDSRASSPSNRLSSPSHRAARTTAEGAASPIRASVFSAAAGRPAPFSKLVTAKATESELASQPGGDSAESESLGGLKLTADPRASVELSGPHLHRLGQTPLVALRLTPGRYQVLFRNDTFGMPVSADVMVVAGGSRSVHADFRQAEPTVSVR